MYTAIIRAYKYIYMYMYMVLYYDTTMELAYMKHEPPYTCTVHVHVCALIISCIYMKHEPPYTCTVHDVIGDVERKKERRKERKKDT